MSRLGKIARLPRALREELNCRLSDGEPGSSLLPWLNGHPDVVPVLTRYFAAVPISDQNLSEWRQRGYLEWERRQEAQERVRGFIERSSTLQEEVGDDSLADRLSNSLTAVLAGCLEHVTIGAKSDTLQWRSLQVITQELARLRRGDHAEQLLRLQRERWEAEQKKQEPRAVLQPSSRLEKIEVLVNALNQCSMLMSQEDPAIEALDGPASLAAAAESPAAFPAISN